MSDNHAEIDALLALFEADRALQQTEKLRLFKPYEPQMQFFEQGATKRERLFLAGSQLGKTEAGAFETACHLTGLYPAWWVGKRFAHPVEWWAGGEGGVLVRDVLQQKLCGKPGSPEEYGHGMIPKATLLGRTLSHGVTDAYETIRVRHTSGGTSTLGFKSYDQGRIKWQAATLHGVWMDEEPPDDIYDEALARLTGNGMAFTTCTPLKGDTTFIRLFWPEPKSPSRGKAQMGYRHVSHYTEAEKAEKIAGFAPHQRAARENGDPVLEGGAIFSAPESELKRHIPVEHLDYVAGGWKKIWGIDFGFTHPFAAALCAIDPQTDIFYVMRVIRMAGAVPIMHASAMRDIAANPPVAWPHDGTHTEKGTGDKLADVYKRNPCNLNMLAAHATHTGAGGYHVRPGLTEMDVAMRAGKFKVLDNCHEFFEEYRTYRTDEDGKIVKVGDDIIDAVRCAWMMRRFARPVPFGSKKVDNRHLRGQLLPGADKTHWGYGDGTIERQVRRPRHNFGH